MNNNGNNSIDHSGFENINNQLNLSIPKFKISILGDFGVGKTSYVTRFLTGEFCDKYSRM
jgi:GTPase SAR1 family protein